MKTRINPLSLLLVASTGMLVSACVGPFRDSTNSLFIDAATTPPILCGATPSNADPLACDRSEKDIAKGDVDGDGDDDFIIARKRYHSAKDGLPGNDAGSGTQGRRSAVLVLNDGGVLRDRTSVKTTWGAIAEHMTARDVTLADIDGNGTLDAIFANTAQELPRIYRNRGGIGAAWLGFEDITASAVPAIAIPITATLPSPAAARFTLFCAVAAADIDGDGDIDLYFSNYFPGTLGTADVLLVNQLAQTGTLTFTDESVSRLGDLRYAAFGTGVVLKDMDNNGSVDIIKTSTLYNISPFTPFGTFVLRNNGSGVFHDGDAVWTDDIVALNSPDPYMFDIGDFNGDGLPDVYEVSDRDDWLNFGQLSGGVLSYAGVRLARSELTALTGGVGGNIKHLTRGQEAVLTGRTPGADANVVGLFGIAPIDVEFPVTTCLRANGATETSLFRNVSDIQAWRDAIATGEALLPAVSGKGGDAPGPGGRRPWEDLAHDFEFTDVNGDNRLDMFMGLCTGYKVLRGVRLELF